MGGCATLLHYLVLIVIVQGFDGNPVAASAAGAAVGAVVSYFLNYYFTFRSRQQHLPALIRFLSIAIFGLLFNTFLVYIAYVWFGLHYLLAQVLATSIVLIWNFCANRLWTFRPTVYEQSL